MRLGNAVGVLLVVGVGIVAGCMLSASEALEEPVMPQKRHGSKPPPDRQ